MFNRLEMIGVSFGIFGVGNTWAASTVPPGMIQNVWFFSALGVATLCPVMLGISVLLEKRREHRKRKRLNSNGS